MRIEVADFGREVLALKELIGKLSRGTIEYEFPELETSVMDIKHDVEEGQKLRGFFEVFSKNDSEIKGIVYSSDNRVKILKDQFIGKRCRIEYDINGEHLKKGDSVKGRINIVSNGGELFVPFDISIKGESLSSSMGEISNLFHFIDLVKQEYDEALRMFTNPDFERIILKDNLAARCMYAGLIKGNDKRRALEEFIIALNKKQNVEIIISDTKREYDGIEESYGDVLTISKSTWGYLSIDVKAEGDFITNYKKRISDEDFAGSNYEFEYLIDKDRLHGGINYGKLVFETVTGKTACDIIIYNKTEKDEAAREVDKCRIELNKLYLDFRLHKINVDFWSEKSLACIERARGFNDNIVMLKIMQAQICISRRREDEAKWLLDSVAEEILDKKDEDVVQYCYYLYVRTLQRRELEQTIIASETIRKYYESGFDKWELLWILLYIDTSYENNKSLKLTRIKEQFNIGCRSTLMYYEALYVLNRQPALLRVLNNFELQVLNFGAKYGTIDLRLAVQLSELALLEKKFKPILYNILSKLYEKFENKIILNALISVLIRGNKTDKKYFRWYELGILADVQVTRLFEHYVFSMPEDFDGNIPNTVLMYYVYNGNLLLDKEGFYYTKIIEDKEKHPNVYKNYIGVMERFVLEKSRLGEIDDELAVIYNDILSPGMITDENEKNMVRILNTWKIECEDDRMCEVIVSHKEIERESIFKIKKGKAFVQVYTDDAIILFRDLNGNIFQNSVDYKMTRLISNKQLDEIVNVRNTDNIYLMAKECEQSIKYHKSVPKGITLFKQIMENEAFRVLYKDYIVQDIIEYYTDNYDGEELDEYLESIDLSRLGTESRVKVIELMIMRGLYESVRKYLIIYGYRDIDPRKLLKYCSRNITEDMEYDEDILEYANYAFICGKYNESILRYLCKYYNGSTKDMIEVWRVSKEFDFESRDMEERLIAQMLFARTLISSISVVYDSYYKKGSMEMLRNAYLNYLSNRYFVRESPVEDMFFKHLEDELEGNMNLADVCKCAYLKYYSEKNSITGKTKGIAKECIEYLAKKDIYFDFFKDFDKWFNISANVLDKTTIVYRTEPQDKVMINYYIETGDLKDKEYISEEMKRIFEGMYIKSFTLFFGEKLNFYISEVKDKSVNLTESREYELDDGGVETSHSRYGLLNDILVCKDLKEENIVKDLAEKYYLVNEMTKNIF